MRILILTLLLAVAPVTHVAAAEEPGRAVLEAVIDDVRANVPPRPVQATQGANWWLYDVRLRETGGKVGITVESWRKCYRRDSGERCEPWRGNIRDLFGSDRIPAGGSIRLIAPAWLWAEKTGGTYTISAIYRGLDDNGHAVEAGYEFSVQSE